MCDKEVTSGALPLTFIKELYWHMKQSNPFCQ